ncbi:MAG TPA: hypothetical protein ENI69_02050 [Rhodospirillales bacterium]|mgnify:CR=1 FL=1|nr:hypothetical protein [Rhodospirillales bacterium]
MSKAHASVNERVYQSRERRRQAGLKRIEVFVPVDQVDMVKAYAAQLRQGSNSEVVGQARKLIAKAYRKFHSRCLDNISIDPEKADLADAAVVAAALMHRGNAEAHKLGRQIRRLAK